ncbi:MAG: ATP-binding protein [Thermodesulfobacteriota bacterium]|nr:ATP-binding protein [Thermodesulfobacteriota bacterium]
MTIVQIHFYSLRTGILANLLLLIVSAMLLTNVVMVKLAERDLMASKMQSGELLLSALIKAAEYQMIQKKASWADLSSDALFSRDVAQLLHSGVFGEVLFVDRQGSVAFTDGKWGGSKKIALALSRKSLRTKERHVEFCGSTWGVVWVGHESILMSAPLFHNNRVLGGVTISTSLLSTYETLRQSEKLVLIYIALNTILFVLFGIYLLSRTVIRPVHKLLRITEEFKEGDPFPDFSDSPKDEIGQLSHSLNMMLKRLEENKGDLREHIASLEKANQEIEKARDEVVRSEKLVSVGRLATGVAHEIGNPIGIILGYLELLRGKDVTKEEREDFLERIESEIKRINEIIRELLDFSRPSSGEPRKTSVHDLITDTVNMLKLQPMMHHVLMETSFEAKRDLVWADPNQLKQVFVNIIINSADALAGVREPSGSCGQEALIIKTDNNNGRLELRFEDTGPGINKEDLSHIFDPFFTTKEPGKGTGLGLSVSYRIVEALGGALRADSAPGKGATIIIDIPLCKEQTESRSC